MISRLSFVGILIVGGVSIIGLGYMHYTNLLASNSALTKANAELAQAVDGANAAIDAQRQALVQWNNAQRALVARVDEMARAQQEAAAETRRLHELFGQHNLERLSFGRPGLIERRLNDGTRNSIRMLECATGADRSDCPD